MKLILYAHDPADRRLHSLFGKLQGHDVEILPFSAFGRSYKKKAQGAFVYLEAVAEDAKRVAELGAKLGEMPGAAWGVIDRTGVIDDPSGLFFAGASDYIGPALAKVGLSVPRLKAALAFARLDESATCGGALPFKGWSALTEGELVDVHFCYAAIGAQRELLESIGDKRLYKLCEEFSSFLERWAAECGGIVWIREPAGTLVLFPPTDVGMNPILAAWRLILDRILVGYEIFHLDTPLTFRFAFHAGRTPWRRSGATGTVVSEDVNFVFHLGHKAAADGAVTVSETALSSIPAPLCDLFLKAGDYEGHSLMASRHFKE